MTFILERQLNSGKALLLTCPDSFNLNSERSFCGRIMKQHDKQNGKPATCSLKLLCNGFFMLVCRDTLMKYRKTKYSPFFLLHWRSYAPVAIHCPSVFFSFWDKSIHVFTRTPNCSKCGNEANSTVFMNIDYEAAANEWEIRHRVLVKKKYLFARFKFGQCFINEPDRNGFATKTQQLELDFSALF